MQGGSEEKRQGGRNGRSQGREAVWERVRCREEEIKRGREGARGEGVRQARTEGRERDREKRKEQSTVTKINE